MPAKQHLNFHGTVSTFVCRLHSSLTGATVALPTPSTPRTVLSTTRERGINAVGRRVDLDDRLRGRRQAVTDDARSTSCFVSTVSPARRAALIAPALLASLPFFFVMHNCCRAFLDSCDTVSCRKVSLFSLVICVPSRAIVSNSFVSAALRRVNARDTARLISVTSAFSTAFHQCVLGASRVALRPSRCVLLTEGCDQRGILQHLLRTLLTGGDLLDCCAADCVTSSRHNHRRFRFQLSSASTMKHPVCIRPIVDLLRLQTRSSQESC